MWGHVWWLEKEMQEERLREAERQRKISDLLRQTGRSRHYLRDVRVFIGRALIAAGKTVGGARAESAADTSIRWKTS